VHLADEAVADDAPAQPPPGTRLIVSPTALLVALALINFLNYVDRYVIGGLTPLLKKPFAEGGLALTGAQIGLLGTAFMIVHSVGSIPLGYLADRFQRKRLIAMGVGVWSIATALAGFAKSFGQMFVARAAVGIGEATYAPAASALISDRFTAKLRARVLGVFQLGMVLGSAVGLIVGSTVGPVYGWRVAFWVVGFPGIALAIVALLMWEPPRRSRLHGAATATPPPHEVGSWTAAAWITFAGIATTFFTGALGLWGPEFILRQHYGGDTRMLPTVTAHLGPLALGASIAGVLVSSVLADRVEKRRPGAGRLLVIAAGVLISAPCATVAFLAETRGLFYVMLTVGVFFNVWYLGPILAALHDVVPPRYRATATGAYFFLIHALGDAISPLIVGIIDDRTGSLAYGLLAATAVMAVAGLAAFLAIPGSRGVARLKHAGGAQ
jgi:MFS family permease